MFNLAQLPRNVEAALRDATHHKQAVRLSALADLSRLASGPDSERVVAKLVDVLIRDQSSEVRARAALALADARARGASASLVRALGDREERVRQMALLALGEVGSGGREEIAAVRGLLNDASGALRFQALVAFHHLSGKLSDRELRSVLERKLVDSDPEVRFVALRIAEERFIGGSTQVPKWLVKGLRRCLTDEVTHVRLLAAIVLHRAGAETDLDAIADAVNERAGVRELEDEQAAVELAGELRIQRACAGLERRAFGWWGFSRDPFAWQARVALAKMGHRRAVSGILADLRAWTWETRTLAAAAAGAAGLVPARARLLAMLGDESSANQDTVRNALAQIDSGGGD